MTAKDIISITKPDMQQLPEVKVEWDMPVIDVVARLLDNSQQSLTVVEDGETLGVIDRDSLLDGLGRMIAARDDCSVITVECSPQDYSASALAHAVEDTDAHLVDLFTSPAESGLLHVTMRVRHSDPTAASRSLERYGYNVVEAHGASGSMESIEIATERLLALRALMNV